MREREREREKENEMSTRVGESAVGLKIENVYVSQFAKRIVFPAKWKS